MEAVGGKIVILDPDFNFKDNAKVLPLIEMIARRTGPGEPLSFGTYALGQAFKDDSYAYTIRGLECGPYDYRGAFSQSITDSMGLWFSNRFEIDSTVIKCDYADWAVLNESLVMGLESYGVSSNLIVPTVVDTMRHLDKRLKYIPKSVIKHAKPKMLAGMISAYSGSEILPEHIIALGDRCWRLIYEINIALGFNMLEDTAEVLPEHFYIDPESNHYERSIVPYRSMIERYCFLRKNTIALQSVDAKAN